MSITQHPSPSTTIAPSEAASKAAEAVSARKPRISIGMPVYNRGDFVGESLDSFLCQTFTDFELVICDNASSDRTEEICRDYAARDKRIRYFRNDRNLGAAKNYRRVFELSVGEYFKWAAADDLCGPEYLRRCVEALESNPGAVLAYPKTIIINEKGERLREYDDRLHLVAEHPSDRFWQLCRSLYECNAVFGVIRRDVLKRTPLLGPYIGSDNCLLSEMCLYGKFIEIPEFLFLRREHPSAYSCSKTTPQKLEFHDPRMKEQIALPNWRYSFELVRTPLRVPLGFPTKLRVLGYALRSAAWRRRMLMQELLGAAKSILKIIAAG